MRLPTPLHASVYSFLLPSEWFATVVRLHPLLYTLFLPRSGPAAAEIQALARSFAHRRWFSHLKSLMLPGISDLLRPSIALDNACSVLTAAAAGVELDWYCYVMVRFRMEYEWIRDEALIAKWEAAPDIQVTRILFLIDQTCSLKSVST
jgi:hypothetical protein